MERQNSWEQIEVFNAGSITLASVERHPVYPGSSGESELTRLKDMVSTRSPASAREWLRKYFERVKKANTQYTTIQQKGWKTDRGRVLLVFGEPSEIERYPNQVDTKPYEIWNYHELEGGVIFVFADLTGFSDYQLIHSTKRGEISDPNWQSKINTH